MSFKMESKIEKLKGKKLVSDISYSSSYIQL